MQKYLYLVLLIPTIGFTDWTQQGTFAKCVDGYSFEVGSYNIVSGKPKLFGKYMFSDISAKDMAYVITDNENHEHKCEVAGKNISIKFNLDAPRDRGQCGVNPGGRISLVVDEQVIFSHATMNNSCFDSIEGIKISSYNGEPKYMRYQLCGHIKDPDFGFDGCLQYSEKRFSLLPVPLSSSPLSKLLPSK